MKLGVLATEHLDIAAAREKFAEELTVQEHHAIILLLQVIVILLLKTITPPDSFGRSSSSVGRSSSIDKQ